MVDQLISHASEVITVFIAESCLCVFEGLMIFGICALCELGTECGRRKIRLSVW